MFRKPVFWLALFAASVAGIYFSATYFSRAYPIVTLDLRMNREAALTKAADLAARFQLPPAGYNQVASFNGDQEVQNFVELEGGGTAAFRAMMAEGLYYPYKWSVRHFKPGETRETRMLFTPRGDPYGFNVKLPEKESGAALPAGRAQEIAEQSATRDWQVALSRYRLVEKGQEVRPGGRIDHSFVYERPDVQAGEGRYRLRLVTGGDRLTELSYFVKVPEAFSRRYEEMRSTNNVISAAGTITLVVLYLIGGCGAGLFFLSRQRWVLWRKPLFWGSFIAFLQLLAGINQWPLLWMGYDTAISAQGFVVKQALMILLSFLLYTVIFTASFMAAESLSRRAFPDHPQMWRLWSAGLAPSKEVLGRTAAGYLLVGVFFAYDVWLYLIATRSLGWWTPSDILVQPDILATYLPWLSPIAVSAQAGFWEECLFRAVPLACAALLGARYGRRNWWIAGAMVVQALIFGSGHAGYANQPAYARLVELIIPSFMFGGLYLYFGLLPGIVLHYTFDVVWLALPLFVSSAPGIWWNRSAVIILVFVPLWVVFGGRIRAGRWLEMPDAFRNQAWQPAEPTPSVAVEARPAAGTILPLVLRLLPAGGVLGLVLWFLASSFKPDAPPLTMQRGEAIGIAQQALAVRKVDLPPPWRALASAESEPGDQDRFVWQTSGKQFYADLMQTYLAPPHWLVRFVRFEGKVEETAEEYRLLVSNAKGVFRMRHILPEARAGSSFPEPQARSLAHSALQSEFGLDPALLREVSAVPSKLKARTDWTFTFDDQRPPRLPQGEKRITIQIAGEAVVDAYRFIHVPEDWERRQKDKATIPSAVRTASSVLMALVGIAGVSFAVFSWSRKRFIVSTFLVLAGAVLMLQSAEFFISIPAFTAQFSTAQPYKVQMFLVLGVAAMGFLVYSVSLGLLNGLLDLWCTETGRLARAQGLATGLALGAIAAGLSAPGRAMGHSLTPTWADSSALASYLPFLATALSPVTAFLSQATVTLLLFAGIHRLTREWSTRRLLCGSLLFAFGFVVSGMRGAETVTVWLVTGAIAGAMLLAGYVLVARFALATVLPAVGALQVLATLKQGITAPIPGSIPGTAVGVILTAAGTWFWYKRFSR